MSRQNQKNSIKKLAALIGVASASVFLSVPALALSNSNSSSFDGSLKNRTLNAESSEGSRQLLAQGSSGTSGTGTGGTGTVQPGTSGTDTGGTGTGQTANFEQLMRAGYAATQQRDYSTALTYFQQALQLRPNNPYARRAVSNVQGYMQRDAQRGTTTTPANQSGR